MPSPAVPAARILALAAVLVAASPAWPHPEPAPAAVAPAAAPPCEPPPVPAPCVPSPAAAPAVAPAAAAAAPAAAAPTRPWWDFGEGGPIFTFGSATSFVYDINEPDHQVTGENPKTYANGQSEESFNIDLVQLGISGSRSIVSYGVKLDYGDWSEVVSDNVDGDFALQEAFLAIDAGFGVISAGRIPTPLGYEVIEPWANANISRSRAWFYQSVSHDGAAISGEIGAVSLMAAVVNGFKVSSKGVSNPDDEYGVIASAEVPLGDADFKLSAIYSDEQDLTRFFELNGTVAGNWERYRYGLDLTWLDGDGHGNPAPPDVTVLDATGYAGATFGSWSGDFRLSYTDQKGTNGNFLTRNSEGIVSFTATGGYEIVDGVVFRAEYRVDSSSRDIFDDHNSEATAAGPVGTTGIINVVQLQLMWTPATGGR